jgi:hypothetical protein
MPNINGDVYMYALLLGFFDQISHVRIKIAISEPKRILWVAVILLLYQASLQDGVHFVSSM